MTVTYRTTVGHPDDVAQPASVDADLSGGPSFTVLRNATAYVSSCLETGRRFGDLLPHADFYSMSVHQPLGSHFDWQGVALVYPGSGTTASRRPNSEGPAGGEYFDLTAAEIRIEQLESAAMPSLFVLDDPDGGDRRPLSAGAIACARQILHRVADLARRYPIHRLSIFWMPDGGLQLQQTRADSTLSVEIPADTDHPIVVEQVSDDEYRCNEFRGADRAADFVAYALL